MFPFNIYFFERTKNFTVVKDNIVGIVEFGVRIRRSRRNWCLRLHDSFGKFNPSAHIRAVTLDKFTCPIIPPVFELLKELGEGFQD